MAKGQGLNPIIIKPRPSPRGVGILRYYLKSSFCPTSGSPYTQLASQPSLIGAIHKSHMTKALIGRSDQYAPEVRIVEHITNA
jgi:hypothetical protein